MIGKRGIVKHPLDRSAGAVSPLGPVRIERPAIMDEIEQDKLERECLGFQDGEPRLDRIRHAVSPAEYSAAGIAHVWPAATAGGGLSA